MTGARPPRVVVGVDGSPGSARAVQYAAEEARRRDGVLVIVTAVYWDNPGIEFIHPTPDQLHAWGEHLLDLVVTEAGLADGDPPVEKLVADGHPAQVLVDEAVGAACLVVGRRGRGAVRSALIGSVSLRCVLHAPCPVVVIPPHVQGPGRHRWRQRVPRRGNPREKAPR